MVSGGQQCVKHAPALTLQQVLLAPLWVVYQKDCWTLQYSATPSEFNQNPDGYFPECQLAGSFLLVFHSPGYLIQLCCHPKGKVNAVFDEV